MSVIFCVLDQGKCFSRADCVYSGFFRFELFQHVARQFATCGQVQTHGVDLLAIDQNFVMQVRTG